MFVIVFFILQFFLSSATQQVLGATRQGVLVTVAGVDEPPPSLAAALSTRVTHLVSFLTTERTYSNSLKATYYIYSIEDEDRLHYLNLFGTISFKCLLLGLFIQLLNK